MRAIGRSEAGLRSRSRRPVRNRAAAGGGGGPQTATLRPNGTVEPGSWSVVGGTLHAVLADDSDATYIEDSVGTGDELQVDLSDFVPSVATGVIITPRVRVRAAQIGDVVDIQVDRATGGSVVVTLTTTSLAIQTLSGTPQSASSWTASDLDGLTASIFTSPNGSAPGLRVYEVYVDVTYTP